MRRAYRKVRKNLDGTGGDGPLSNPGLWQCGALGLLTNPGLWQREAAERLVIRGYGTHYRARRTFLLLEPCHNPGLLSRFGALAAITRDC